MTITSTMCVADGGLINPDAFPTKSADLVVSDITGAADGIRAMATTVHDETGSISATWSGLSASYEAPEQQQVYDLMNPAVTAADGLKSAFDSMAGHLDTYATALEGLKSRLSTFESTAADFRAEVINGVETIAAESNEADFGDYAAWTFQWVPGVEQRTVTVPWYEDSATVERNQNLLDEYAGLLEEVSTAATQCANDINALVTGHDIETIEVLPAEAFTNPEMPMPWGEFRDEDRNCPESVGHGFANFGTGIAEGAGMLVLGYNPENGEFFQGEGWGQAWGGLGNLVGSVLLVATPAMTVANTMAATGNGNAFTDFMQDRQDVVVNTAGSFIGYDGSNPDDPWHKWKEDGVATGTESILNVGTFFIPGAGQVGAGLRVGSAGARVAKIAAIGADFLVPGGSWVVKGGVRVATGLSDALRVVDNAAPGVNAATQVSVQGVKLSPTALLNAVDDIPASQTTPPPTVSQSITPSGSGSGVNAPAPDVSAPTTGSPSAPVDLSPGGPRTETTPGPSPVPETTPAPVEPSPAPVEPSPVPVEPSPVPVEPSPVPVEPSPAPTEPSPAPAEPNPAPAPAEPSPAPAEPSPAPTEPNPAPEGGGEAPEPAATPDPAPAPAPEQGTPGDPAPGPGDQGPAAPEPPTPPRDQTPGGQPYDPEAPVRETVNGNQAPDKPTPADVDDALRNAPVDEHGRPVDHRDGQPLRPDSADGTRNWHMKWDPETGEWVAQNPGSPRVTPDLSGIDIDPSTSYTGNGTVESPLVYQYDHPTLQFADADVPSTSELSTLGPSKVYDLGSVEHMQSRWRDYQAGDGALPWDEWRDRYIRNTGHLPRGTAFEQAYFDVRDMNGPEWEHNTLVDKTVTGIDRNYDALSTGPEQRAVEVKSGSTVDPEQVAKDTRMVRAGWDVHYVFGQQPSPATIARLEKAGVTFEVFHSVPVPQP